MKKSIAIPAIHPEYQLYQKDDTVFCSSLQVAEGLGKRHADVIRDIRKLIKTANSNQRKVSLVEDNQRNLRQSSNIDNAPNLAQSIKTEKANYLNMPCAHYPHNTRNPRGYLSVGIIFSTFSAMS